MHDHQHAERIIEVALQWARAQKNILAVALVGSYARKTARPESDIDLVMLTDEPTYFRTDTTLVSCNRLGRCQCAPAEVTGRRLRATLVTPLIARLQWRRD